MRGWKEPGLLSLSRGNGSLQAHEVLLGSVLSRAGQSQATTAAMPPTLTWACSLLLAGGGALQPCTTDRKAAMSKVMRRGLRPKPRRHTHVRSAQSQSSSLAT